MQRSYARRSCLTLIVSMVSLVCAASQVSAVDSCKAKAMRNGHIQITARNAAAGMKWGFSATTVESSFSDSRATSLFSGLFSS